MTQPNEIIMTTDTAVALLALTGSIVAGTTGIMVAIIMRRNQREMGAVNRAVNNRAPNEPILYDLVKSTHDKVHEIEQWKAQYQGGPLDTGAKANEFVKDVHKLEDVINETAELITDLRRDMLELGCPVKLGQARPPECRATQIEKKMKE